MCPCRRRRADRARAVFVPLLVVVLAGCGRGDGDGRPAGSAVWLAAGETLPQSTASALAAAGIGEIFVEAGSVAAVRDGDGDRFGAAAPATLPGRTVATLVVDGTLAPTRGGDGIAAVVEGVRRLIVEREASGWVLRGVHLDLAGSLHAIAGLAEELGDELAEELAISATVAPGQLVDPALEELLDEVDSIVVFAYGQRPEDRIDDPGSWDLEEVERVVRRLEELGEPYQLGVSTLGYVTVDAGAGPPEVSTAVPSSRDVLLHHRLELRPGFTLAGIDRQVYLLRASADVELGPLAIPAGADVRVHRLATVHLQRLRAMLGAEPREHLLGELYYRLPRAGEGLSLQPENLVAATRDEPARPQPRVELELLGRGRGTWTLRARLINDSAEESDLSALDGNYVELVAHDAWWSAAPAGQFRRAQTFSTGADGVLAPTFRSPGVLRLYHPILLAGDRLESGELRLTVGRAPRVAAGARFVLPDGEVLLLEPAAWTPPP